MDICNLYKTKNDLQNKVSSLRSEVEKLEGKLATVPTLPDETRGAGDRLMSYRQRRADHMKWNSAKWFVTFQKRRSEDMEWRDYTNMNEPEKQSFRLEWERKWRTAERLAIRKSKPAKFPMKARRVI